MDTRNELLEICERSLRKYLSKETTTFDPERSVVMLECHIICQSNLDNELYGDKICFNCASICIDCLDTRLSTKDEEISRKFDEIHRYIKATYSGTQPSWGP